LTPTPTPAPSTPWQGLQFSLGGIPVLIRPAFVLIAIVFGSAGGTAAHAAIWVGIVFVSVLIHELGHAAAMRAYGFSPTIELHAMGGLTAWSREKVPSARQQLIVTACGPGAGLVLGGLITIVRMNLGPGTDPMLAWAVMQAQWVNIGWSVINLMPVLPWDGGLILDSAVEVIGKRPRPKIAAVVSVVVGAAVAGFGIWQRQIMLIYFGGVGVWQGYSRLAPKKPEDQTFNQVWALMQAHKFAEAERLASEKANGSADPEERAKLFEAVAWSRLLREDWRGTEMAIAKMGAIKPSAHLQAMLASHAGQHEDVIALLTPLPSLPPQIALRTDALIALKRYEQVVTDACDLLARADLSQRKLAQVLAAGLFEAGAWEPSLQVSLTAFKALGEPVHLLNAACALSKLGQLDEALATLNRAIDAGFKDHKQLVEDPDLAPLRPLAGWQPTLTRVAA
jgi:Zn-dependent protease